MAAVERRCFLSFCFCIYSVMYRLLAKSSRDHKDSSPTAAAQRMALRKMRDDLVVFMLYGMEDLRIKQAFLNLPWYI